MREIEIENEEGLVLIVDLDRKVLTALSIGIVIDIPKEKSENVVSVGYVYTVLYDYKILQDNRIEHIIDIFSLGHNVTYTAISEQ